MMRALAVLLALLTSSSTLATNDYDHAMRRIVKDRSFLVSSEYRTELTYGLGRDVLFERKVRDWQYPVSEYWDEYIWLGGERIAAHHRSPSGATKTFFFVNDRMGTARRAYDADTGALQWRVFTDPWGRGYALHEHGATQTLTPSTFHRGPGQYEDAEFGLVENGYRVLVPELGQYTSADPLHRAQVYSHFGPQAYAYAGGDPNQYVDPSGLLPMDSTGWDDVATSIQGMSGSEKTDLAMGAAGALAFGLGAEIVGPLVPPAMAAVDAAMLRLYSMLTALLYTASNATCASISQNSPGALRAASEAARAAAARLGVWFPKNKHLLSGGSQSKAKFLTDNAEAVRSWVDAALRSDAAHFLPNPNLPGTFRVMADMGQAVGIRGQQWIRVVVSNDGWVINAFPIHGP